MRRTASEWGEYVAEQGLYGFRADNVQRGGNLDLRDAIPAMSSLDELIKEDERSFEGYIADPLVTDSYRVTTEEVEVEEEQSTIGSLLGGKPETKIEEKENKEHVWVAPQERDFFEDYDLDGTDNVSFMHIPFTVGNSGVRSRGGNSAQYERLDIILPSYSNAHRIGMDLNEELNEQGNLNRFAEGLAEKDGEMNTVHQVTEKGGEFAPRGLLGNHGRPTVHPAEALEDDQQHLELRNNTFGDLDLEVPGAVESLEPIDN